MVIVKTLNPDWFGTKKVIAAAGEVHPDKVSGQFEIAEEHLEEVLELYPDIVKADLKSIKPAPIPNPVLTAAPTVDPDPEKEEKLEGEDENQENLQKNEEDDLNPKQETITGESNSNETGDLTAPLQEKTLKELQELAKVFPRKEWGTLNKTELIEFLKNKLA